MPARTVQSTAIRERPIRRNRADAPLAIAREIARNEFEWQVKQGMELLSDYRGELRHCGTAFQILAAVFCGVRAALDVI